MLSLGNVKHVQYTLGIRINMHVKYVQHTLGFRIDMHPVSFFRVKHRRGK